MDGIKKIAVVLLCLSLLVAVTACKTSEEQARIDAENLQWAEEIAQEYFEEGFEYDFHFYGGGGEGDTSLYMYVFKNGDTINCVAVPARENVAGPFVYYDCTLYEFSSGGWFIQSFEDTERVY